MEKLKQKIYKLLPDLKELEFGCEIEGNHAIVVLSNNKEVLLFWKKSKTFKWYNIERFEYKIIGKPIGLAEVLRALGEKYAFEGTGMLLKREFGSDYYSCAGMLYWNLKENLDNQSKEVIEFLNKLIN